MASPFGDKGIAFLSKVGDQGASPLLSVGFFSDSQPYEDGATVPEVAFDNEFGVPSNHQPPRPFFRSMIQKESATWGPKLAAAMKGTGYDGKKSLALVGDNIVGALTKSINDLTAPPLSPVTIAKKGFDKPLIDTTNMINSIESKVDD